MRKDAKVFVRKLSKLGFDIVMTGGDHYGVFLNGKRITCVSATPGDRRWRRKAEADIRKYTGIVV